MNYFAYSPTSSTGYCGIALDLPFPVVRDMDNALIQGTSLLPTWNPPKVILDPPAGRKFKQGDFFAYHGLRSIPVMSARAWSLLQPLMPLKVEVLPLLHIGPELFLVNILETTECIDPEKSLSDHLEVFRFSINFDALEGRHIARAVVGRRAYVFVDEVFRNVVEANGLRGLIFNPLPLVGNDVPVAASPFARKHSGAPGKSERPARAAKPAKYSGKSIEPLDAPRKPHLSKSVENSSTSLPSEIRALDDSVLDHLTLDNGSWLGRCKLPWLGDAELTIKSKGNSPINSAQRQAFAMLRELANGSNGKQSRLQEVVQGELVRTYERVRDEWMKATDDPEDDRSEMGIELVEIATPADVWEQLTRLHVDIPIDQSQGQNVQLTWEAKAFDEILLSVIVRNGIVIAAGEYGEVWAGS